MGKKSLYTIKRGTKKEQTVNKPSTDKTRTKRKQTINKEQIGGTVFHVVGVQKPVSAFWGHFWASEGQRRLLHNSHDLSACTFCLDTSHAKNA